LFLKSFSPFSGFAVSASSDTVMLSLFKSLNKWQHSERFSAALRLKIGTFAKR